MFSISKEFSFDAAHRLVHGYEGKCAHVHGHTWLVTLYLRAANLDIFGMVRDFGDIKPLRKWVDDNLDHALIISAADTELYEWAKEHQQRMFVLPDKLLAQDKPNPTSEWLAYLILRQAQQMGLKEAYACEINETCTSKARYERASD